MRLHRVSLRNFRGVESADIEFAETGVTIVEGPNEIGKSSIAEAIQLLFDEPDSSGKQRVKSVKPVHLDAGPGVEAELTSGPYRLVYAKQWLRQPSTTLTVSAPAPENHTGRAAHDRVVAILGETLDVELFRALRWEQGVTIAQAEIGGSPSLARALDAAASGGGAGTTRDDNDGLWPRVEAERLRYVTATGRPTSERTREVEQLDGLHSTAAALDEELHGLESAAERHRQIMLDLAGNASQRAEHGERLAELEAAARRAVELKGAVDRLHTEAEKAQGLAREAATATAERQRLVQAVADASEQQAALQLTAEQDAPGVAAAGEALAAAVLARDGAHAALLEAEQTAALALADHDHLREALDTELLAERFDAATAAEQGIRDATAFLEGCPLDDRLMQRIDAAELAAAVARTRATAGSSAVTVEALAAVEVQLGGETVALAAGERLVRSVAGDVALTIGDVARIGVAGATAARELAEQAKAADQERATLYESAGVDPVASDAQGEARELLGRRRAAEESLAGAKTTLAASLRDLTVAELGEKLARSRARLAETAAGRAATPPLPADVTSARAAADAAGERVAEARRLEERLQAAVDRADEAQRAASVASIERGAHLEAAARALATADEALATARAAVLDDGLATALVAAEAAAGTATDAAGAAAGSLAEADPATAATLLSNAQGVRQRLLDSEQELLLERERIKAVLETRGQAGLADQLATAESEIARRERAKLLTDRRAAAAELLYARLAQHRDAARRSYVAPYKAEIERLARIVFGPGVSVEIDHATLRITSRTLDGITVPFESLSGGAREQLAVLARLACAALVSPPADDGPGVAAHGSGVPVIFDDALGNSDPARLERLGAAFSVAGDRCQVIVLTCVPDRYAHIGSATVVRLGA